MEGHPSFEINEVFTLEDIYRALRKHVEKERAKLSNQATNTFRRTLLDNQLPTPEQAQAAIEEAVQLGRFQMTEELAVSFEPGVHE